MIMWELLGLVVLGLGISYSLLTILICAVGGIFGAVIVIVLSLLGVTI
jgi:hypothetical protein